MQCDSGFDSCGGAGKSIIHSSNNEICLYLLSMSHLGIFSDRYKMEPTGHFSNTNHPLPFPYPAPFLFPLWILLRRLLVLHNHPVTPKKTINTTASTNGRALNTADALEKLWSPQKCGASCGLV
jgi:hypothetical protein